MAKKRKKIVNIPQMGEGGGGWPLVNFSHIIPFFSDNEPYSYVIHKSSNTSEHDFDLESLIVICGIFI